VVLIGQRKAVGIAVHSIKGRRRYHWGNSPFRVWIAHFEARSSMPTPRGAVERDRADDELYRSLAVIRRVQKRLCPFSVSVGRSRAGLLSSREHQLEVAEYELLK